jgi:hypothetical protein
MMAAGRLIVEMFPFILTYMCAGDCLPANLVVAVWIVTY